MAFHIELRVNLVKTLQVPIFYSSYPQSSKLDFRFKFKILFKYSWIQSSTLAVVRWPTDSEN
jgi:hypothetical protein